MSLYFDLEWAQSLKTELTVGMELGRTWEGVGQGRGRNYNMIRFSASGESVGVLRGILTYCDIL